MKITKQQLRRIIREERSRILNENYKDITIVAGPTLEDAARGFSASMYFDSPGEVFPIPLKGGKLIATLNSDGVITVDIEGGNR
jgi:hypothetical protein